MANINFRERRLFSLFSSIFIILLTSLLSTKQGIGVRGDLFTSLSKWGVVVRIENNFVALLDEYVKNMAGKREESLVTFLEAVKPQIMEANKNIERFVSHPVNCFLIIKRFTSDWLEVERIIKTMKLSSDLAKTIDLHKPLFPSYEDLEGASEGLFRLQDTYQLTANQIANGKLSEQFPNATLDTEDCFQVGLMAYHRKNYIKAKEWMIESLKKFNPEIYSSYLTRRVLQEYIAWCEYETGNADKALNITKEILTEHPHNVVAMNNIPFYENALKDDQYKKRSSEDKSNDIKTYERLCRGTSLKTKEEQARLTCYYDKSRPQLFLKPAKVEVLNLNPWIVKYKNVITDEEIKVLKKLASPRLQRATINNIATGKLEYAKYRVSKSAWLDDFENVAIDRLSKRIKSLTGLETDSSSAEQIQVGNYGIGGHYEPHWDHATNEKGSIFAQMKGNRIATFLIYMSDVEVGGYTVFVYSEAIVKPSKGDAVFWYNLRRSGAGDSTTRHAACPVVVGSKWVSNKWIHSHGQEFRRKCGLNYDGLVGEKVLYKWQQ